MSWAQGVIVRDDGWVEMAYQVQTSYEYTGIVLGMVLKFIILSMCSKWFQDAQRLTADTTALNISRTPSRLDNFLTLFLKLG